MYESCTLCGRNCKVNRREEYGYCGESAVMKIALASLHFGEEPPLVKKGGSGTIFFSGCSLGCSICQNFQISRGGAAEWGGWGEWGEPGGRFGCENAGVPFRIGQKNRPMGREVEVEEFARICLALEREGAENINLVTGTHFIPSILEGLRIAREKGLNLPIVWNSSGYDSLTGLALLVPVVDIFLVDCKTLDPRTAESICRAPEYPGTVLEGLAYMVRHRALEIDRDKAGEWDLSSLRRGVIIRHLVIPGFLKSTRQVLQHYSREYRIQAILSLMTQYAAPSKSVYPRRGLSRGEYEEVTAMLLEYDIEDGFLQEPEFDSSIDPEWLPDFSTRHVFPSDTAKTVWHWSDQPQGLNPRGLNEDR